MQPGAARTVIRLASIGSFFAGGRPVTVAGQAAQTIRFSAQAAIEHDPNGTFHVEQAYVQSFVPEDAAGRSPLVLVHGGCLTGAMWETTPDGRPGWLEHFLRAGWPVHVVDGVERGRAGWCALPGIWPDPPVSRSAEQMWSLYRIGPHGSRTPFPGQRFPVASFDTLLLQHVPRWFSTIPAATAALLAALERIGPSVLLSHSNGGLITLAAAWQRPDLVRGLVCVEPSGFPPEPPPRLDGLEALLLLGDFLDRMPLWRGLGEAMTGLAATMRAAGAGVTDWRLPEQGIAGNSHMMMMDDNGDAIAAQIDAWLRERFLSPAR